MIAPLSGEAPGAAKGRTCNLYDCQRLAPLSEYAGRVLPGGGVDSVDPDLAAAAAAEGEPRLVAHLRRERKPALAAAKRRAMIEQLGYASPC